MKILAIFFGLISLGGIRETVRIITSMDADIAQNRTVLIPMSLILTSLMIYLAIRFWKKSIQNPLL